MASLVGGFNMRVSQHGDMKVNIQISKTGQTQSEAKER